MHLVSRKPNYRISHFDRDYLFLLYRLNLLSLQGRRILFDLLFAFKVLNDFSCCPNTLSKLYLNTSWHHLLIHSKFDKTIYGQFNSPNRIFINVNIFTNHCWIVLLFRHVFRRLLLHSYKIATIIENHWKFVVIHLETEKKYIFISCRRRLW